MTKAEQRELLDKFIRDYRSRPYAELSRFADPKQGDHFEVRTRSGGPGYIDVYGVWDNEEKGHLRVVVGVYDSGLSAFLPATDDFIIAPDGTFIGE